MRRERRKFRVGFKEDSCRSGHKEQQTIQELASKHELHPKQINTRNLEFLNNAESVFTTDKSPTKDESKGKKSIQRSGSYR